MKRLLILFGILTILPAYAAAEIMVEEAWVRLPPPVAETAAGYMTIRNHGDQDIEITGVKAGVAEQLEFHAMTMHDGMMHMQKMEKVVIPAHGGISFDPGDNHLMLIGLQRTLEAGEHLMITLETSDGQEVMVHAEVRDMRNKSEEMDHGEHMDHGSGDSHHNMH
ncbi:MAG: copper chaperone PCu(A)C [Mariprofundaceae bacterium]|nr:copper chaperone PCu(A)C [Mariprofundaceae bacterium]